jgi:hypothetical protein
VKVHEEIRFLHPEKIRFFREGGRLSIEIEGEVHREVTLTRLFPLSEPEGWISVFEEDEEVGIVKSLKKLDRESRKIALEELRRRYVVPRIRRILSLKDKFDLVEWEVITDRGRRRFLTKELRENIQRPLPGHIIITDVEGNRYQILSLQELDPESQALVERYL